MTLSEHRAAARIAWRHARRARGRTALTLALIAFPIMALAGAGFVISTAMASPEDRVRDYLGSAELQLNSFNDNLSAQRLLSVLPPGTVVSTSRSADAERVYRGTTLYMSFLEHSAGPDKPPVAARYALLRGRMPRAPGEATLHPGMLAVFGGPAIGEEFEVAELGRKLRLVGVAVQREGLQNLTSLLAPGTLPAPAAGRQDGRFVQYLDGLIDLPAGASVDEARQALSKAGITDDVLTRADVMAQRRRELRDMTAGSLGGAVGVLFGTGLITAAAFGVGARRQLRALGLLGVAGGEPRHVRLTVLWGGTVVGLAGSAIGVVLGIGAALAARPHMSRWVPRMIDTVRLPWLIIAVSLALGTLAATVAAIVPARRAERMTTVDALAGRLPKPKPPGRIAARGLISVLAGGSLMGIATATKQEKLLGVALVLTLGGFLLSIPLMVSWVGHFPTALPKSLRFAARQTARYGRRTGAAVAAATLALTAPVAIAAHSLSDEEYNAGFLALGRDQVVVRWEKIESLPPDALAAAQRALPGAVGGIVRPSIFPRKDLPYPDQATVDSPPIRLPDGSVYEQSDYLMIGDANVLRAMGAERAIAAFGRGTVVASGRRIANGRVEVHSGQFGAPVGVPTSEAPEGKGRIITLPAIAVPGPREDSYGDDVPRLLISEPAAVRAGLGIGIGNAALLRVPHDLTKAEIARVKDAVAQFAGVYADVRGDYIYGAGSARVLVTVAAVLVALIIVAVLIVLIGAETRRDRAMLVAVGAGPGMRRKTTAAAAFLVTWLAGVLAVPAGFIPVVIVQTARPVDRPIIVPWTVMGLVAIGAPLVAALFAAVSSREPSGRTLLQPSW